MILLVFDGIRDTAWRVLERFTSLELLMLIYLYSEESGFWDFLSLFRMKLAFLPGTTLWRTKISYIVLRLDR